MTKEIQKQVEDKAIDSLVIRGDISGLNPQERAQYYMFLCKQLGLTAAAQPFAILKLNGKDVLYPTRQATDQLAAMHRLNREIIDGPKVIDLGGTKLIYCQCRITHPNGRVETAVATLPLTDPLNVMMKVETKSKRRATLSILGLGALDHEGDLSISEDPDNAEIESWRSLIAKFQFQDFSNHAQRVNELPEPVRVAVLELFVARLIAGIKHVKPEGLKSLWARVVTFPEPLRTEVKKEVLAHFKARGFVPQDEPTPPSGVPVVESTGVVEDDPEREAIQNEPAGTPASRNFAGPNDHKAWLEHLRTRSNVFHVCNSFNSRSQSFRAHGVMADRYDATIEEIVRREKCTHAEAGATIRTMANRGLRVVRRAA